MTSVNATVQSGGELSWRAQRGNLIGAVESFGGRFWSEDEIATAPAPRNDNNLKPEQLRANNALGMMASFSIQCDLLAMSDRLDIPVPL